MPGVLFVNSWSGGARVLAMEDVPEDELDELYQCSDVRVVRLRMRAKKA